MVERKVAQSHPNEITLIAAIAAAMCDEHGKSASGPYWVDQDEAGRQFWTKQALDWLGSNPMGKVALESSRAMDKLVNTMGGLP